MIVDYIQRIAATTSMEALWEIHVAEMARFGFDRLFYGYTHFRRAQSVGDLQDLLILTNHGPAYSEPFLNEGHYHHAPMVRWALENTGACSWRWMIDQLRDNQLTPSEARVVEFNKRHGVTVGYSISFSDPSPRNKGAIALTAKPGLTQDDIDKVWAKDGALITAINTVAHLKIVSLPHSGFRRPLTPRQREALEWVGEGKTTQDIATIMGLTAATVEKHLRLARESLEVDTTAQAVLKASLQNQMYRMES